MSMTLKDRVRNATAPAADPAAPGTAAPVQGEQAADGGTVAPDETAIEAADAVMQWLNRYDGHFTEALPAHVDRAAFFAAVRAVLPSLAHCTPASVLQSLLTCARFGLVPDGRHAVITRDGKTAVFIPMYGGYVDLMFRSGLVESVHVGLIHEADEWSFEPTAPAPLDFTHKPRPELGKAKRGPAVLAYSFCWLKGGGRSQVAILNREDAEAIRDEYSKAYRRAEDAGRSDSYWHTHFDQMWSKTALRRMAKLVPLSPDMVALTAADDAGDAGQAQILHAPLTEGEAAVLVARQDADAEADAVDVPGLTACEEEPVNLVLRRKRNAARRGGRGKRQGKGRAA